MIAALLAIIASTLLFGPYPTIAMVLIVFIVACLISIKNTWRLY